MWVTKTRKIPANLLFTGICLAEREGFEPSSGYKPEHDFQSCALDQLSHLSKLYKQLKLKLLIYYSTRN